MQTQTTATPTHTANTQTQTPPQGNTGGTAPSNPLDSLPDFYGKTTQAKTPDTATPPGTGEPGAESQPEPDPNQPAGADETPGEGETPEPVTEFVAENGRKLTTLEEAGKLYNESSREALRLAREHKDNAVKIKVMENEVVSMRNALLEMKANIGNGVYPHLKTEEQLETLTEEERINYLVDKREWTRKQDVLKASMDNAAKEHEAYVKHVQEQMARTEATLRTSPDFPDYDNLAPIRGDILTQSPWLDGRPETPYVVYLMAQGLARIKDGESAKNAAAKADQKAKETANANASHVSNPTGPAKASNAKPHPDMDWHEKIVKAHKSKTGW